MAAKKKGKTAAKRSSSARASVKKKTLKKKKSSKKKALKKQAVKKKTPKKKVMKKISAKPRAHRPSSVVQTKEPVTIEPGPAALTVPPVEEPAANEEAIGTVTHYYSHLGVAVVQINKGILRTGDTIRVKGITTDFTQQIESMEYEHQHVAQAAPGQSVGLKVTDHAREHDILYRVR